ncbi:DUF1800 domain-containing protein [Thalassoroseus pseudoceratinae]|uniref:DUF1800 domain-containing protein n=1 Tax=Thalassoroseus pseudoceratinae TaxID=2713176 RepID=UPI001421764C|nr:DUF1800 domain-containing protein [Thalassoroseus pseudoceratinae]
MSDPQTTLDRFRPRTAWAAYYPNGGNPWDNTKVAHLLRRATFGANSEQLESGIDSRPATLVSQLLQGGAGQFEFAADMHSLVETAIASHEVKQLQAAWVVRMLSSPHPLQERLTLFWHDHFATSQAKVDSLRLMQQQNETLRQHALGHFSDLLAAMVRDPAMLIWLDSDTNRKGNPNENLAREVFELFSLGVGNYSEQDIKEAARALTGWRVQGEKAIFDPSQHDTGPKTILGQTGRWSAGDVVRIALQQPACARFLVRKVFREFVSETVELPEELLNPLADEYRLRDYDTAWLMGTMFRSWFFYSDAAIGQRIKSPVEFLIGAVRCLGGQASPIKLAEACDTLGQSLFFPPSVKGWDGGAEWIDPNALLLRQNLAYQLTRGNGPASHCDPATLAAEMNLEEDRRTAQFFLGLFLQSENHPAGEDITKTLREQRNRLRSPFRSDHAINGLLAREAAHLVMTLPEFQVT